jgi:hypothetical protein
MADSRGLTDLPLAIYTNAMPSAGVSDPDITAIVRALFYTSKDLHTLFKDELPNRVLAKQLWQAVINDDRAKVMKLAKEKPELFFKLLTLPAPKGLMIASKHTFRMFDLEGETLLSTATKLKQLEMIKVLLTCSDQLVLIEWAKPVLKDTKVAALSQWVFYDTIINANNEEEIDISEEYLALAGSLLEVFKIETFPNGVPGIYDKTKKATIPYNVVLSNQTELALTSLLDILVPKTAVKLDGHIDVELFLLALYRACRNHILAIEAIRPLTEAEWDQMDALCVRAIGLTQDALIPETAEILCESLYGVAEAIGKGQEKKISDKASLHIMQSDDPFYRSSRNARAGLGFDFLCGIFGWGLARCGRAAPRGRVSVYNNFVKQKQQKLGRYAANASTASARPIASR